MIIYLVLLLTVGFPLLLGEISLGRKSGKAAIEAYRACDNGIFSALSPVFLLCFYCSFGAYVIKYFTANLGDLLGLCFGVGGVDSGEYFSNFISSGLEVMIYNYLFLGMTTFIVMRGISNGIEKFCNIFMPALFIMLVIITIRSVKCKLLKGYNLTIENVAVSSLSEIFH